VTARGSAFSGVATSAAGSSSELGPCIVGAVSSVADLQVSLAPVPPTFDPGDAVNLRVTLRNNGPAAATNVSVYAPAPPAIGQWTGTASSGVFGASSSTWHVFGLPAGQQETLDLAGTLAPSAAGPIFLVASAEQNLSELDGDLTNNHASTSARVRAGADLRLTITPAISSALPGGSVDLDIAVENLGPEAASAVLLNGVLDLHLDLASPPPGLVLDATARRWALAIGDLAKSAVVHVSLRAVVDTQAQDSSGLRLQVSSVATSGPVDPAPELARAVIGVPIAADLAVENLRFQGAGLWAAAVVNHGPDTIPSFGIFIDYLPSSRQPDFVRVDTPLAPNEAYGFHVNGGPTFAIQVEENGSPYFDPDPTNDRLSSRTASIAACGLLGIEAPIFVALVGLLGSARGRRGLRRLFGARGGALALALLASTAAEPARAAPLTLGVDSAASSATLTLASPLGSPAPVPVTLSGSVDADAALASDALFGLTLASLELIGGAVAFSDASVLVESFPLFSITLATQGVAAGTRGPATAALPAGSGLSLLDFYGSELRFDAGSATASGSYYGVPVDETLDLAPSPFRALFPLGSVVEARVVDLGGGQASLELRVPFSAPLQLAVNDTTNTLTFAGTLVLTGTVATPEPALAALLAVAALAGLARRARGAEPRGARRGSRDLSPLRRPLRPGARHVLDPVDEVAP
jgi:uncharacterized repeat protein (TIGR01451 family)